MLFDDVRFMPGELADQLLSVFRLESKPLVELREPVSVRITDGKVYQKGLVVPVGNVASIALDGSVDFEKNLDMVARFALNPPRSRLPVLSPLVETARFELPIRGTLAKPKIDGEALKEKWKTFGDSLLARLAGSRGERSAKAVSRHARSTVPRVVSAVASQGRRPPKSAAG